MGHENDLAAQLYILFIPIGLVEWWQDCFYATLVNTQTQKLAFDQLYY